MPRAARFVIPAHWPVQDRDRYKPLDWFIPYEQNARTHPPAQVTMLAGLLTKFGPDQDIVVDENRVILKGHGRRLASLEAGLMHFTFVQRFGLSESEKTAMRIQDNVTALLSSWDAALIQGEIGSLKTQGYDILQLGFPEAQLRGFGIQIGTEGLQDSEAAPEPPKRPIVRAGDLWGLGEHRILCGDATSRSDVTKALGADRPNLMVTDPPFGDAYDPNWRRQIQRSTGRMLSTGANYSTGTVANDDRASWIEAWRLFPGNVAYIWHGERQCVALAVELESLGLKQRNLIVWGKRQLVPGRGHYHSQHETCLYVVRDGATANWKGDHKQTTLWDIPNAAGAHGQTDDARTSHSTQKPLLCMQKPIDNNSSRGDYVYDPFLGSGTTLIAAEMTGRRCIGIEIDPSYAQVSIERWQKFVGGQQATLNGVPFDQVAQSRRRGRARAVVPPAGSTPLRATRPRPGVSAARLASAAKP